MQKTPARKLYYIGSRYGVGTIRERPAKDDLQRPPQRRGGVAEILRKGVQADGRRPLYERSGPVPLRPNGVRQMQAQHQSIRYVRHGKRTVYEPGMSRSQKPRIHRAKSGELLAQNPKFILCKDRYGCDDHDKAVEHMTENGVECKAFEYGQVQEMPAMPAEPCPADYATDADYTVAMQIYEQQKRPPRKRPPTCWPSTTPGRSGFSSKPRATTPGWSM